MQIWIVGDGFTVDEQLKAPKGTLFIPFSQFPPKKARSDAFYYHTPSLVAPSFLQNLHSCEVSYYKNLFSRMDSNIVDHEK